LVKRLEREGLVARIIDPEDARATLVVISDSGRALHAQLHESLDQRLMELLGVLSEDEEARLGLAMRVALPLLQQLTRHAMQRHSPPNTSLNT
jgi:DNA-binding MarR family transcriptional regulator